ncbi:MAG: hypothetical protein IH587_05145 [Anaerolineae bacterium]|nr:hypothetical protein [Anaerolineae bacterium]
MAGAQTEAPLIFWASGDLWLWSASAPAMTPLTADGTVSSPSLSPAGGWLAYRALSPVSREALDRLQTSGFIAEYDLPTDIFLVDLNTQQTLSIAPQPAGASLFVEGVADNALVRSEPAWSPEGDAVAWVEFSFGASNGTLITYRLAEASTSIVATGITIVDDRTPEVRWGRTGIVLRANNDDTGKQLFQLYGLEAAVWTTLQITVPDDSYVQLFDWVDSLQGELLGVLLSDGSWRLLDPRTGVEVNGGTPALYSRFDAAAMLALRFDVAPETGFFWEIITPDAQATSPAFPGTPGHVAIAPDNQTLAFIGYPEFGSLAIWREGTISAIAGTGSSDPALKVAAVVFWSPLAWRVP